MADQMSKDEILESLKDQLEQQQRENEQQRRTIEQQQRENEQQQRENEQQRRTIEQQQRENEQQQRENEQQRGALEESKMNLALLTLDHTLRTLSTPQCVSSPTFTGAVERPNKPYPELDVDVDAILSDTNISTPLHFLKPGENVDPNNSSERNTQNWYNAFLESVVQCCFRGKLEVVDTCQRPFPGLGMQPDLLVCQTFNSPRKKTKFLFPEMVLGVIELKAGNSRGEAECQIVQRVEELLHFVRQDHTSILTEPFTLHGIVADDVGARWVTVTVGCYGGQVSNEIPISRIFYSDVLKDDPNAFVKLFVAFLRALQNTNEGRPSSKVDGVHITRFHLRKPSSFERNGGKASVYLEVNGNGEESIVKLFPDNQNGREQFTAEKDNIEILQSIPTARDLVKCFTFECYGDTQHVIRSSVVGAPLRFRNGKDAKKCFDSILGELKMLWDADMYHGDVSPKNIVMVENKPGATYHLIDFGNTEGATIAINKKKPVPNRGTMPFTVPGASNSKGLDTFQLGASVIFTYGFCSYKIGAWWGAKSVDFSDVFAARRRCLNEAADGQAGWSRDLQSIAKGCIKFLDTHNNNDSQEDEATHAVTRKRPSQLPRELPSRQMKKDSSTSPDVTHRPEEEDSADAMIDGW